MPDRIKKQSEEKLAKKEAERIEALKQEKELFKAVMLDLENHITLNVTLLEKLKNMLNVKLDGAYAANKQLIFSPKPNGKTDVGEPIKRITGSLSQVLSILFLINNNQNQLFQDMEKYKLPSSKINLKDLVAGLDGLLEKFHNLSTALNLNLTFVHGKDLSSDQLQELNVKRQSLDKIINEQIEHNKLLHEKLSQGLDKNLEQTKPPRAGLGS